METMLAASNPKIDTTPLPDDQPVSLLEEAQDYYRSAEPPFVTRNTGKNANGNIKRVALATADGKYPQLPVTVNCTHRLWSKGFTYPTVDLNEKRRIVKSRSGGPSGGASYICKKVFDFHFRSQTTCPSVLFLRGLLLNMITDSDRSMERSREGVCRTSCGFQLKGPLAETKHFHAHASRLFGRTRFSSAEEDLPRFEAHSGSRLP